MEYKKRPDLLALSIRNELIGFVESVLADQGTNIDSGGGLGAEDISFIHQGVKINVQVKWPETGYRER